jgi:hypothetical protein
VNRWRISDCVSLTQITVLPSSSLVASAKQSFHRPPSAVHGDLLGLMPAYSKTVLGSVSDFTA